MAIFHQLQRAKARINTREMNQLERKRNRRNAPPEEHLTHMQDARNIAEFDNLRVSFFTDEGIIRAVDGVSFAIPAGSTCCVVGESGCGKSVMSLSLLQLLQRPQGQIVSGTIRLNTGDVVYDIANTPEEAMQRIRGGAVSMIFQEPMTSLNPVICIGDQLDEAVYLRAPQMTAAQVKARSLELLELVNIGDGEQVYRQFPHTLSGGMRQRVMIAMSLSGNPKLIIADEPTTALDVTIQAQILDLLRSLKDKMNTAVLLITHDLGVVAEMADFVVVMYAGRIVEAGEVGEIFRQPLHPYTVGLLESRPVIGRGDERLSSIPGVVPNPMELPQHCYFYDRCPRRMPLCREGYPGEVPLSPTHRVSCYCYAGQDESV